jgi:hypothetical protein
VKFLNHESIYLYIPQFNVRDPFIGVGDALSMAPEEIRDEMLKEIIIISWIIMNYLM